MSFTDLIGAIGAIFTGVAAIVALFTFIYTWHQYRTDQHQQRAAQTREVLQSIITECSQFLRPLGDEYPYPILHTATDISREFCSRMGEHPRGEDVRKLLGNEKLLRSICVEGWIKSTQIFRMLSIAEELERKASSHYLRGKLLLICDASFFLAGLVAQICSPDSFFIMLRGLQHDLEQQIRAKDNVEDALNTITMTLQDHICSEFDHNYSKTIKRSLYFIQLTANVFIKLSDTGLLDFAKAKEEHTRLSIPSDSANGNHLVYDHLISVRKRLDTLDPLHGEKDHAQWKKVFHLRKRDTSSISSHDYAILSDLITSMKAAQDSSLDTSYSE